MCPSCGGSTRASGPATRNTFSPYYAILATYNSLIMHKGRLIQHRVLKRRISEKTSLGFA